MPRMPQDEAEALFKPHADRLVECVRGGVDDYFASYPPALRALHRRSTRASIIRDHIVARIELAFYQVRGVNFLRRVTKGNYFLLAVGGRGLARIKMLVGRRKRARNFPTALARQFNDNNKVIAGLSPRCTRFNLGYAWNSLQTGITSVSIACPTPDGDVEYVINLWVDNAGAAVLPHILPQDGPAGTKVVPRDRHLERPKGENARH